MTMKLPIYLDYMASTPIDKRVLEKMVLCLQQEGGFANPSSNHIYGWQTTQQIELARKQVASLLHAEANEIIWTSGATEANNLAIKGAAEFYQRKGKHLITMTCEHKAVLDPYHYLASQGFEVTFLNPNADGLLNMEHLLAAIREETILVSIMHVNNETGVIQDLDAIGKILKERGILFHVDAAQSAGKIDIDLKELPIDLMSLSSHKIYGPKGVGALYVRQKPKIRLSPLLHGGGQEKGLRSGTLPTHQIVAMGLAFEIAAQYMHEEQKQIFSLREKLWHGIVDLGGITHNGSEEKRIPGCLNIQVAGVDGESLLTSLRGLAISSGSACNSASIEPSHVLMSMGLTRQQAHQSIRISIGRFTTDEEIEYAIAHIRDQVQRLRNMSPIWDRVKAELGKNKRPLQE